MKFLVDKQEKYTFIQLLEEKLDSTISPALKSELVTINAEGFKNLIIDLGSVKYIDSSGLSSILVANRLCSNDNGILVLTHVNDHAMKLIKISQLDTVLNILPTKEEGIDAVFMNEIENDLRQEEI